MRVAVAVLVSAGMILASHPSGISGAPAARDPIHVEGFDDDDLRLLGRGGTVAKTLPATDKREIVVIGAVTLPVSRDRFVRAVRNVVAFRRGSAFPQLGRFSDPPSSTDLDALTLDASDLRDLRECRPARCKIHLPQDIVDAVVSENGGSDGTHLDARLSALFKTFLARRAAAYLDGGKQTLRPPMQRPGMNASGEIDALLTASAPYVDLAPRVFDHLRTFPERTTADVEHALYWSKQQFGWKPVIAITHWALGPTSPDPGRPVAEASLQLYASHYVDASLALMLIFEPADARDAAQSCRVIFIQRSRVKAATGTFGSIVRRQIESRMRDGLRRYLQSLQARPLRGGES
jgi:hypothetical protein